MDVLRHNDGMNGKRLTANGTPRRLPSLKQPRAHSQGTMGTFHASRPFNPPIGGGGGLLQNVPDGFALGGTSIALPHIVPLDHLGFETSHTDRSEWRKKRGVLSKASWYSAEDRERERERERDKEMNPEPMPFMSSVFKAPPLDMVRVQGVPFPSLASDTKLDTVSTKSRARSIASPTPSSHQARASHNADRSSTVIKRVPNRQRHAEMWASPEYAGYAPVPHQGFAFHTDRYQFEDMQMEDDQSVPGGRDTAQSIEFIDRVSQLKYVRSRRLQPTHQPVNMLMGGKQVMLFERMDITDELRKLKSISLPKKAKDLYVGRGFKMPEHHAINKPRPSRTQTTPNNGYQLHIVPPDGMPSKARTDFYQSGSAAKVEPWSKTERVDERSEDGLSSVAHNPQVPKVDVTTRSHPPPAHSVTKSITSAASRGSPTKVATPNPLKTGLIENFIESTEYEKLRKNFKRLDTDMDGHLMFNQLKTSLPKGISHAQERYIKQVYDITSSSTFFGINEYISMSIMCNRISFLDGQPREAFHKINFATLEASVKQYADLFQSVDRSNSGKVSADSLKQILTMALDDKLTDDMFKEICDTIKITNDGVNKMDYLAYIPYFLLFDTLEVPASSISVHGD